jgi:phospholipid/cholesterol/gamma-HCH transport system substrate-binding protein
MKLFAERNPYVVGAVGCLLSGAAVLGALQYRALPFIAPSNNYSAYFAEAGGLKNGDAVRVAGLDVGRVASIDLEGDKVLVKFDADKNVWLGDRTEAAIKTKTVLGAKFLEIIARGDDPLTAAIPVSRTTSPYQLADALGELATSISGLNTDQLSDSLSMLAQTFRDTPADLKTAVEGVARFSQSLDQRDSRLRTLLANANKATAVLADRSDQVVGLITDTNAMLVEVQTQSAALDSISTNLSALSRQLSGFISDNRTQFKPAVDALNNVLTIIDNRKERLQKALKLSNQYTLSFGESLSEGPFFNTYVSNLLPGQFMQPFIDAAFSDLGVDPATLLPSQRIDPQTGQPGTPALPVPFPRTGQGGAPRLTIPDAITGNPADPRYPLKEEPPAPPPGGPPPGPPAVVPPPPTPSPVLMPAPGEVPALPGVQGAP